MADKDFTDFIEKTSISDDQYLVGYDVSDNGEIRIKSNNIGGDAGISISGTPVDNDIAKFIDADTVEGRSYAELKADLNLEIGTDILAQKPIGISDDNLVEIDDAGVADNDYARFTANGLEGRSYSELISDLSGQMGADFDMNTNKLTNVTDPASAQDAATKNYVDNNAGGLTSKIYEYPPGAWTVYNDPRAIYYNGNTYFGYANNDDVRIAKYNHTTGDLIKNIVETGIEGSQNDHINPALHIRNDGKILMLYTGHANNYIHKAISDSAEDISSFTLSNFGSEYSFYSMLEYDSNGKLYFIYMTDVSGGSERKINCYTSTDDGDTWSNEGSIFDFTGESNTEITYTKTYCQGSTKIHFICSRAINPGTPNFMHHHDILYAYWDITDDTFYKADGTSIDSLNNAPLNSTQLELVYDSSGTGNFDASIWDIVENSSDNPVITFITFDHEGDTEYNDNHHFAHYGYFDGASWQLNQVASLGRHIGTKTEIVVTEYGAGCTISRKDPNIVYYSRQDQQTLKWNVFKAITSDNGTSWRRLLISDSNEGDDIKPIPVYSYNGNNEIEMLYVHGYYDYYDNFDCIVKFSGKAILINQETIVSSSTPEAKRYNENTIWFQTS